MPIDSEVVLSQLPLYLLLIALLLIFYQDYKERAVHLLSFTLMLVSILWLHRFQFDIFQIGLNFCFLLVNILVVFMYLRLRLKISQPAELWQYLGVGDVLFWGLLALLMPFSVFVVFFLTGLLFTALMALMFLKSQHLVPLAGLQAIWLFAWILMDMMFMRKDLILTDWLYLNFTY